MLSVLMRARVPLYMHRKRNHIYTVWQHIILLALRQYEGKSYRRFVEWLHEYLPDVEKRYWSFGVILKKLQPYAGKEHEDLLTKLSRFNMFTYRPAKHDFRSMPKQRKHRFTVEETILLTFVTAKLAKELCSISKKANKYCKEKQYPPKSQ